MNEHTKCHQRQPGFTVASCTYHAHDTSNRGCVRSLTAWISCSMEFMTPGPQSLESGFNLSWAASYTSCYFGTLECRDPNSYLKGKKYKPCAVICSKSHTHWRPNIFLSPPLWLQGWGEAELLLLIPLPCTNWSAVLPVLPGRAWNPPKTHSSFLCHGKYWFLEAYSPQCIQSQDPSQACPAVCQPLFLPIWPSDPAT